MMSARSLFSALLLALAASAAAQPAPEPVPLSDGEIRKVDRTAGKLTIKHGELKHLDMPGMTMVFAVRDATLLDKLQPGDKIRFAVVNDAGKLIVTDIQPAK